MVTVYNYFRDYDPELGRYIQSDPIGLSGGINTYGYVGGNPIGLIDPLGLNAGVWAGAEGGMLICGPYCSAVGGVVGGVAVWYAGDAILDVFNEEADDITNDLIDDLVPDPHDYPSDKTPEQCDSDFDRYPGEEIPTDDPERRIKRLPDGRIINIHPSRYRPGVPTLDVPRPGSKKRRIKVRYQG